MIASLHPAWRRHRLPVGLVLFVMIGCGSSETASRAAGTAAPGSSPAALAPAPPPASASAAPPTTTERGGASASAKVAASAEATAPIDAGYPAGSTLPGRSPVPTIAEWNAQTREVTVKGSSALRCETKTVREWLRVSCRDKNDTGGTPTGVRITQGAGPGVFTLIAGGVVSVVLPFVEGTVVSAVFSWTDKSHRLGLAWPKGSPEPAVYGAFEGAASPLDEPPRMPVPGELACQCDIAVNGSSMCLPSAWIGKDVAGCERKYLGNCRKMMACADGAADAPP